MTLDILLLIPGHLQLHLRINQEIKNLRHKTLAETITNLPPMIKSPTLLISLKLPIILTKPCEIMLEQMSICLLAMAMYVLCWRESYGL